MSGLYNVRACLPEKGIVRVDIEYENGVITRIGEAADKSVSSLADNAVVVPGFIDQHIHGLCGSEAMDASFESLDTISRELAKEGTVAFLATTLTQSPENIKAALTQTKNYVARGNFPGAEVIGVHLEGPFISPKFVGAQNPEYVQKPEISRFAEYQEAAGGLIRIVSMAPETEGAGELIAYLLQNGVSASAGHTAATYADMKHAVEMGMKCVTHTYNAQSGVHHRDVGVAGSAMLFDELYTELICDTVHVSVPALKLMIKNKPADKVILITDSIRPKGLPEGEYELGGLPIFLKGGEIRLVGGALAGSSLRANYAIRNLVEQVGVSFETAIGFATANPARHLGVYDRMGSIEVGKDASFAVLDDTFEILQTVIKGKTVYRA